MVTVKDLTFFYDKGTGFTFPQFSANAGSSILITGGSGKGKTTLLHLLGGLLRPKSGGIIINETDITKLSDKKLDHFRGKTSGWYCSNHIL
ncbi:ATP-binding cassette domain-containing protein [Flavobacterium sp. J372]|uniref:ATP-binding cassette domain-containing protein n=1 Tax=Flavobacterium sp. J372 TaxID=2898436 RepID=UPI002150E0E6|nr:ATP-binding cassette domain-containing protein [Flavobacterium sp. J372]